MPEIPISNKIFQKFHFNHTILAHHIIAAEVIQNLNPALEKVSRIQIRFKNMILLLFLFFLFLINNNITNVAKIIYKGYQVIKSSYKYETHYISK